MLKASLARRDPRPRRKKVEPSYVPEADWERSFDTIVIVFRKSWENLPKLLEHFGEDRVSSESRIYQVEEEGLEAVLVRLENVVCRKRKGKFRIRDVKDPEIEFSFYKDEAYWIDGWPSKPTRVWTSIYVDPAKPQIRLDMPCRWAYM